MSNEVTIKRVENGWMVSRGYNVRTDEHGPILVFNDMGYASATKDNQRASETLLGWIAENMDLEQKP
jgi:hypothetical protein